MKTAIIIFMVLAAILAIFTLTIVILDFLAERKKDNVQENADKDDSESNDIERSR